MAPVHAIEIPMDDGHFTTEQEKRASTDDERRIPPSPAKERSMMSTFECDFDHNPTELYKLLQKKEWRAAIKKATNSPAEARTWVSRREKDGRLRWRLLPLHAAVIYQAPESVVEALLCSYPKGAESLDDQGMLPLHLAFRNGSTEGVINLLLVAFPKSIDVKDRKGRIPLVLAQASNSPNREAFMRALERGPTYYAVAAAATERAAVTAEQRAIFDAKIIEMKNQHNYELTTLKANAEQEKLELSDKIAELEADLIKTQDTSQVLVDHVNSLEAQLASRSDTERFLATKIATLDTAVKSTSQAKDELEATLRAENAVLMAEKNELEEKVGELEDTKSSIAAKLTEAEATIAVLTETNQRTTSEYNEKFKALEVEWANAKASCAILEAQLKKKIETEHSLASQVSQLASRLAESSAETSHSVVTYGSRVRSLEKERDELRGTVKVLTRKMATVAKALEGMSAEQEQIVLSAASHEETMAKVAMDHAKIIADADRHQQFLDKAAEEREQINLMLKQQQDEIERGSEERRMIVEACHLQSQQMELSKKERNELLEGVAKQRRDIEALIQDELDFIPSNLSEDSDIVKAVVSATIVKAEYHETEEPIVKGESRETEEPIVKAESHDTEEPIVKAESRETEEPIVKAESRGTEEGFESVSVPIEPGGLRPLHTPLSQQELKVMVSLDVPEDEKLALFPVDRVEASREV